MPAPHSPAARVDVERFHPAVNLTGTNPSLLYFAITHHFAVPPLAPKRRAPRRGANTAGPGLEHTIYVLRLLCKSLPLRGACRPSRRWH